jgi:hypothetical protein
MLTSARYNKLSWKNKEIKFLFFLIFNKTSVFQSDAKSIFANFCLMEQFNEDILPLTNAHFYNLKHFCERFFCKLDSFEDTD